MKTFIRYLFGGVVTVSIVLVFMIFSHIYFSFKDKKTLSNEKSIDITAVDIKDSDLLLMTIEEKINMLNSNMDIESVSLETGDTYSLYEARKQCFKELSKLSSLEMDIYGPVYQEIDIRPYLLINAKTPSQTMLVWSGNVKIKDISYNVVLEEESGKLIKLESDEWNNNKFKESVQKEWENYLQAE